MLTGRAADVEVPLDVELVVVEVVLVSTAVVVVVVLGVCMRRLDRAAMKMRGPEEIHICFWTYR